MRLLCSTEIQKIENEPGDTADIVDRTDLHVVIKQQKRKVLVLIVT